MVHCWASGQNGPWAKPALRRNWWNVRNAGDTVYILLPIFLLMCLCDIKMFIWPKSEEINIDVCILWRTKGFRKSDMTDSYQHTEESASSSIDCFGYHIDSTDCSGNSGTSSGVAPVYLIRDWLDSIEGLTVKSLQIQRTSVFKKIKIIPVQAAENKTRESIMKAAGNRWP